jgi:CheY-like chemotaxis protein
MGLGLAIVRHLVELHGGEVVVESDGAGRGSTFVVRLPRLQGADQHVPITLPRSSRPRTELEGSQVLVVDDEEDSRQIVALALERAGARVVAVESVAEGLQALEGHYVDLVVTDIQLPGQDGYGLLAGAKARSLRAIPFVALTAHAEEAERSRALRGGFATYLTKPIAEADLVGAVADVLSSWNGDSAGPLRGENES